MITERAIEWMVLFCYIRTFSEQSDVTKKPSGMDAQSLTQRSRPRT